MKTKHIKSKIEITGATIFIQYPWGNGIAGDCINITPLKQSKSGVYCLRNKLNNRLYIGMARNLENRYSRHLNDIVKGIHHSKSLMGDFLDSQGINYTPPQNIFEFEVIIYCRPSELTFYEHLLITALNPYYNTHKQNKTKKSTVSEEDIDNWVFEQNLFGLKVDETREEIRKILEESHE